MRQLLFEIRKFRGLILVRRDQFVVFLGVLHPGMFDEILDRSLAFFQRLLQQFVVGIVLQFFTDMFLQSDQVVVFDFGFLQFGFIYIL